MCVKSLAPKIKWRFSDVIRHLVPRLPQDMRSAFLTAAPVSPFFLREDSNFPSLQGVDR